MIKAEQAERRNVALRKRRSSQTGVRRNIKGVEGAVGEGRVKKWVKGVLRKLRLSRG
jgi:hypothetical protein